MATHFVGAVKEHAARIQTWQASQPSADDMVRGAAEAVIPAIIEIVKQNNVELARAFRNNPILLKKR